MHSSTRVRRGPQLLPALLLALGAGRSGAQRTSYTNVNAWFILGAEAPLTNRWTGNLDVQARRTGPFDKPTSYLFRPSINFALTPAVKLGVGVSRSESYPYGKIPSAYQTPEWRLFEQIQLTHAVERLSITHRYRLEQRWLGRRGADTTNHEIADWLTAGRFRYQVKGLLPLRGPTIDVGSSYLTASDEVAIGFGKNVTGNVFDQNRAGATVGRRFARDWRAETGFLLQTILKPNGKDLEQNYTMTFGLFYTRSR